MFLMKTVVCSLLVVGLSCGSVIRSGRRRPLGNGLRETCDVVVVMQMSEDVSNALSPNGTKLELQHGQRLFTATCLSSGGACFGIDQDRFKSSCEPKLGRHEVFARKQGKNEPFKKWIALLPTYCACMVGRLDAPNHSSMKETVKRTQALVDVVELTSLKDPEDW